MRAASYVARHDGRRQIILSGLTVRSYDFDTGTLLWEAAGLGENTIPQPVQHEDLVFAMSGHTVKMMMAIRLGRKGTLIDTDALVWSTARGAPYTPSPVLHDGRLYIVTDNGLVSCLDAETGEPRYQQQRLPKPYNFKASPVGANGNSTSQPKRVMSSSCGWETASRCWRPTPWRTSPLSRPR